MTQYTTACGEVDAVQRIQQTGYKGMRKLMENQLRGEAKLKDLRSTHVPQKRHSETMSDNETENQREEKHCKYSIFGGF